MKHQILKTIKHEKKKKQETVTQSEQTRYRSKTVDNQDVVNSRQAHIKY